MKEAEHSGITCDFGHETHNLRLGTRRPSVADSPERVFRGR
jgi:hypothetical protein